MAQFKDVIHEKKLESREAFVSMMQSRKKRMDAGEDKAIVEADLINEHEIKKASKAEAKANGKAKK